MARVRKRAVSHGHPPDDDIRNQEVLRANRELAAYFKGRRTERERADPGRRRPLPIAAAAKHPSKVRILRPMVSRAQDSREVPPAKDEA